MFATIIRPRRGGKTHALADIARKNPSAVVSVINHGLADYFTRYYQLPNRVLTHSEVVNGALQGTHPTLLIDNVEYFIRDVIGSYGMLDNGIVVTATGVNL